jgi:hypothetical protein
MVPVDFVRLLKVTLFLKHAVSAGVGAATGVGCIEMGLRGCAVEASAKPSVVDGKRYCRSLDLAVVQTRA